MSIKYLIFGNGYVGNRLNDFLEDSIISKIRINSVKDVLEEIEKFDPEVVINCIGKTGRPNVDWCEYNRLPTVFSNVVIPLLINDACQQKNKFMVHISTGCIYTGDNGGGGFTEDDEPNFFGSFYSRTKLYAEKLIKEFDVLQLRIRIPLDEHPCDKNIINKLLSFDKVISINNSMTYIPDFLLIAKKLIDKRKRGIFNVVNKNPITHPEILDMYKEIVDKDFRYEVLTLDDLHKSVKAERSNCVLSVEKLEREGIIVRDIKDAVRDALMKYKKFLDSKNNGED